MRTKGFKWLKYSSRLSRLREDSRMRLSWKFFNIVRSYHIMMQVVTFKDQRGNGDATAVC
jgi:hypothetical protein